jgi:hypothetical protein
MTRPDPRRLVVVEEARGWLGSPYHHMGRVKGAGTDCLMMLVEVYEAAGVVPHIEVPFYSADWNLSPRRGTVPRRRHAARDRNLGAATKPAANLVFSIHSLTSLWNQ